MQSTEHKSKSNSVGPTFAAHARDPEPNQEQENQNVEPVEEQDSKQLGKVHS